MWSSFLENWTPALAHHAPQTFILMEWPPHQTCMVVIIIIFLFFICWRRKYYLYVFINKDCVCTTTPVFFISLANLSTYLSYTHSLSFYKLDIFLYFSSCVGFHDFLQDLDLPFLINMLEFENHRDVLCK